MKSDVCAFCNIRSSHQLLFAASKSDDDFISASRAIIQFKSLQNAKDESSGLGEHTRLSQ
jgi:hypothetical protein